MGNIYRISIVLITVSVLFGCRQFCVSFLGYPPEEQFASFKSNNRVDELVIKELRKRDIPPSPTCTDEVFIRRVYLDAAGILPGPQDVKSFFADKSPEKRKKLVDKVLSGADFADYQALKWSDILRIKAEFPSNLWPQAAQVYHRWVRESIFRNKPYDKFVYELLCSNGSNFQVPPVNFYRAFQERKPEEIAENIALVFMGIRLDQSSWTEKQLLGMAAFFTKIGYKNTYEWKEEIVYFNPDAKTDPKLNIPLKPVPLNGKPLDIPEDKDPRVVFANWLTAPANPYFSKCIVNRVWYWLFDRGIVHPADDMRPDNPPWSPELLSFLEKELVSHNYDLKHIYRLILNSNTYQLSSRSNEWNASDESGFARYRIRRMDAETLIDVICQITAVPEKYTSGIPEPYTFLPASVRAVKIADGSISSSFLDMFGRSPRNTSFESEKNVSPSLLQALHILNSGHIQRKIDQSPLIKGIISEKKGNDYKIEALYLLILSRYPADGERKIAEAYINAPNTKPYDALTDLAWALLNTKEFILKH